MTVEGDKVCRKIINDGATEYGERRIWAVHDPMLRVTVVETAEFTLNKQLRLLRSCSGRNLLGTSIPIIAFIPLNTNGFGMRGYVFMEREGNLSSKGS